MAGATNPTSGASMQDLMGQLDPKQKANMELQQKMMEQSEAASTLSNIMKAKHDANMAFIGNLK